MRPIKLSLKHRELKKVQVKQTELHKI